MIKVGILTTDTAHHRYFISKVNERFPVSFILLEKNGLNKRKHFWKQVKESKGLIKKTKNFFLSNYLQLPLWDILEDNFEKKMFFKSVSADFPNNTAIFESNNINDAKAKQAILDLAPDVLISFGVNKIRKELIGLAEKCFMNVHRGILPKYRGLDSDLWAVHNKDFSNIGVTIHTVEPELDTGDVIYQEKINIDRQMRIYHLRYHTTVKAADLVIKALEDIHSGRLKPLKQEGSAGYYSYLPYLLKFSAIYKFSKFRERIKT